MCGIAGWLGTIPESGQYAARAVETLHHRGPDNHGVQSWHDCTLVHTRLSIIDLSFAGLQPMANEDGTVWTVFNGEIYNHRKLRSDLETRGHVFKGHSDTEILPHLYEEEGSNFLAKLRGMFALAIFDRPRGKLLLARDRFGIKPLFYAAAHDRIYFASEIRTLLELPGVDNSPDRQAIYDFAALFYIPAPQTFYAGIRALQPGEMLEAHLDSRNISYHCYTYYRFATAPDYGITLSEAVERADALVTTAVRRQLESDVPLGALLSGGIDSSLVSAAAQDMVSNGIRTFNIRFPEQEYDETWAAVAAAQHIGSRHETLDIGTLRGSWDYITNLLQHAGQPFADTSLFAVNAVCRLMRRHVTVALSGDGGDEGFGGYNFYWQIGTISHWQKLPVSFLRAASFGLRPLAHIGIVPERLPQRFKALVGADDPTIVQNLFCWIRDEEHSLLCLDKNLLPVRRLFEPQWEHCLGSRASRLERLSALATEANVRLMLPNDFLFKVDTASMKEGLEVRVPMLDEDLFAFALSLPHRLKVYHRTCKIVLRALAKRKLPPKIANKPKWGFVVPLDRWVDAEFKVRLRELLLGRSSKLPEFFRPEIYQPIIEAFCKGASYPGISRDGLYQRAIMLLSVQIAAGKPAN